MDGAYEENSWTPLTPTSSTTYSLLGKRRACSTVSKYEWSFIFIVSFTLTIILGIAIYRMTELPANSSDLTLYILLLLNIGFCYLYAYHGVLFEQPFDLCFLVITSVVIIVYTGLSYSLGVQDSWRVAKLISICVACLPIVVMGFHIGCGYKMSGNLLFRTVGGDPFMQSICFKAQLQCGLLLFDTQAIWSCIVLITHEGGNHLLQELLVLILGAIFTIAWIVLGYLTVRCESIPSMAVFLTLCTVQPSYVVWRFVSAGLYENDSLERNVIYASGVFFIFVHIYLITNTLLVCKDFGKGLKDKLYGYQILPSYGAVEET